MTIRSLSFHATYGCRHSGVCCRSRWPIAVEADRVAAISAIDPNGLLYPSDAPAQTPALLRVIDHRCAFFDEQDGRTCRVHTALGHEALPLACRQFPRVVVVDPRGVSVTLSHYCPTAAAMLEDPAPVRIVESPPAFPANGEYIGLDAHAGFPPQLRPDVLMDWESWWAFEARAVELIGNWRGDPAGVLAALSAIVERVRTWNPGDGELTERVEKAFRRLSSGLKAQGSGITEAKGSRDHGIQCRFLAAHAFGNWTAHLGQGLRSWLRSLQAAYALLQTGSSVQKADLLLRHEADPDEQAAKWSEAEGTGLRNFTPPT